MSVIYMYNNYRNVTLWEVRRESLAIIELMMESGLECNESVLIIF